MKFDKEFGKNFDEKIKNEMDLLSPSEEQLERIKKGVYERLECDKREKSVPELDEKPKKPLKIKIAAISGAACACAAALVVIVAGNRAGLIVSRTNHSNNIFNSINTEGAPPYDMNEIQGSAAAGPNDYCGAAFSCADNKTESAAVDIESPGKDVESGGTSCSMSENAPQSSEAVGSNIPRLSFSDNNKLCTVTLNGKTADYVRSETYSSIEADKNELDTGKLVYADSSLDKKLLVHFDEDLLYVFYESGEFFGFYTAK